jgi:hypothetical protein
MVPPFPRILQCQFNGTPRAFYCVDTETKERVKIELSDDRMKAAQCVSAEDFKKSQAWVQRVKEIAEERCK